MRGLIKATAYYSNLAARRDWVNFCQERGIDPNRINWQTMSHKKIDKEIERIRATEETPEETPLVFTRNGIPCADQAAAKREFMAACEVKPNTAILDLLRKGTTHDPNT